MGKFMEIERCNEAQIVLSDGTVYQGESWGIEEDLDDDGVDLGFEYLVFKAENMENPLALQEKEIINVKPIN